MRHRDRDRPGHHRLDRARPRREARSCAARGYHEFRQIYPQPGWVEHDPEDIWAVGARRARRRAASPGIDAERQIAAIGITNQRETTRRCGIARPASRCTTRSSGRTAAPPTSAPSSRPRATRRACSELTGLVLDPVLLGHQARAGCSTTSTGCARAPSAASLRSAPSTATCVWRLTGGAAHATDVIERVAHAAVRSPHARVDRRAAASCSACRARCCPTCAPSSETLRRRRAACPGCPTASRSRASPAISRRRCSARPASTPGDAKCTYGTGAFMLMNTGDTPVPSTERACSPPSRWKLGERARATRSRARRSSPARRCSGCATGSASSRSAREIEALARVGARLGRRDRRAGVRRASARRTGGPRRAASITGLDARHDARRTSRARCSRASRCRSSTSCARWSATRACRCASLKVDGGAAANDLLMQFQADVLGVEIVRPAARRDDRARRRVPRRPRRRRVEGHRRRGARVEGRAPLQAVDGASRRRRAQAPLEVPPSNAPEISHSSPTLEI